MGTVSVPANGLVYLDSNCLIYRIEGIEPYVSMSRPIFEAAEAGSVLIVTSELSLLECLVKPIRERLSDVESLYYRVLTESREVRLMPISRAVLVRALHLRADLRLRTPDAIHAATSLEAGCSAFYTNDQVFSRVSALSAQILGLNA